MGALSTWGGKAWDPSSLLEWVNRSPGVGGGGAGAVGSWELDPTGPRQEEAVPSPENHER